MFISWWLQFTDGKLKLTKHNDMAVHVFSSHLSQSNENLDHRYAIASPMKIRCHAHYPFAGDVKVLNLKSTRISNVDLYCIVWNKSQPRSG